MDRSGARRRGDGGGGVDVGAGLRLGAGDGGAAGGLAHADVEAADRKAGLRQRGGQRGGVGALRLVVELDGVEAGGGGGADAVEEGQLLVKKARVGRKTHRPSLSP